MDYDSLLNGLSELGITVRLKGPDSIVITHASRLTTPLREALRAHKQQIINDLSLDFFDYVQQAFGECTPCDEQGTPLKGKARKEYDREYGATSGGLFL